MAMAMADEVAPREAMRQIMAQGRSQGVRARGGRKAPADSLHVTLAFLCLLPEPAEVARGGAEARPAWSAQSLQMILSSWLATGSNTGAPHLLCALPGEPPVPVAAQFYS